MRLTQALTAAAQSRRDHTGTSHFGRKRSWGEIAARTARIAGGLRELGINTGDRVPLLAFNSDRYIEYFFAVAWAGAVSVPLNTRWAVPETEYALKDCDPVALMVDEHFLDQLPELQKRTGLTRIIYIGDGPAPAGMISYEDLAEHSAPIDDLCGADDELAGIFYTGGTTGFPKGVMLSHRNLIYEGVIWDYLLDIDEDNIYLHSAGLFHLAGTSPMFALTLVGATHVTIPKFEPELAMRSIAEERVNSCLFVPTMLSMLLHHESFGKYDLSSMQDCIYGSSPMPDVLLVELIKKLPGWRFLQGYGLTEAASLACVLPWKHHHLEGPHANRRKSTGRPLPSVEVRIVDEAGAEVPRGTVGEIVIRSSGIMLGYWRKPAETARALQNGWLHTGDGAWMDDDGYVYIADRIKDMIVSGAENIYSSEVENAVYQHPCVLECAVIGIPDEKWGEAVHAIVVPKAGQTLTPAEIIAHCRTLIAGYKCPRSVEIRAAPLPLSAAGKIQKALLREEKWRGYSRKVN